MRRLLIRVCLLTGISALAASAGVITTFSGNDNGAVPGGPRPNSNNAHTAFLAGLSSPPTITFEGLPTGLFTTLAVAPGVTAALINNGTDGGGIQNTDQHTPTPLGFNTTVGGTEWLQVWPAFDDAGGETVTFTFSTPINAFGAYLTDPQSDFPGPITLTFNDGTAQTLSITKTDDTGGVLFFGFHDTTSFTSISYHTGATGATRDIWGIDDVAFNAVPEPGTIGLALCGASLLIGAARRFRISISSCSAPFQPSPR
jgi:hypothetical protein